MTILVTGGAGFIGANFVREWFTASEEPVVVLDCLTYAGNPTNLEAVGRGRLELVQGDICNQDLVLSLLSRFSPRAIVHFAAESHVDRSISSPARFVETNVTGTFNLLECSRRWLGSGEPSAALRFVHVSTDEVFGSLDELASPSTEESPYAPNSPYAASKAASDHLVRAYNRTYGLNTVTTNCCNNYGPLQYPEKLIPVIIDRALGGAPIPIYGDGSNRREWLHVSDHCSALRLIIEKGASGSSYNIGTSEEVANLHLAASLCELLNLLRPRSDGVCYSSQLTMVADRPGHDQRYALDSGKLRRELGWEPRWSFTAGLRQTVEWYLDNREWMASTLARGAALAGAGNK